MMVAQTTSTEPTSAAPPVSVTVQIDVSGYGNEVHIDGATLGEVHCSGDGASRQMRSIPKRRWYRRLMEIAWHAPVLMGNGLAAIVIAWLDLLGYG
jgi:hypothetical protein